MSGHSADGVALAHADSWAATGSRATVHRVAREDAEEQHLGDELLARVKLSQPVGATTFALRTDASVFLSGAALEPLLDDPVWMLHTTLNITWGGQP